MYFFSGDDKIFLEKLKKIPLPTKSCLLMAVVSFFLCSPDCPKQPRTSSPLWKFFYTTICVGSLKDFLCDYPSILIVDPAIKPFIATTYIHLVILTWLYLMCSFCCFFTNAIILFFLFCWLFTNNILIWFFTNTNFVDKIPMKWLLLVFYNTIENYLVKKYGYLV